MQGVTILGAIGLTVVALLWAQWLKISMKATQAPQMTLSSESQRSQRAKKHTFAGSDASASAEQTPGAQPRRKLVLLLVDTLFGIALGLIIGLFLLPAFGARGLLWASLIGALLLLLISLWVRALASPGRRERRLNRPPRSAGGSGVGDTLEAAGGCLELLASLFELFG